MTCRTLHPGRHLDDRRQVAGGGPGEDLHLDAGLGQPPGDLDDVDVHAAGVAGAGLVQRRGVHRQRRHPAWPRRAGTARRPLPTPAAPCHLQVRLRAERTEGWPTADLPESSRTNRSGPGRDDRHVVRRPAVRAARAPTGSRSCRAGAGSERAASSAPAGRAAGRSAPPRLTGVEPRPGAAGRGAPPVTGDVDHGDADVTTVAEDVASPCARSPVAGSVAQADGDGPTASRTGGEPGSGCARGRPRHAGRAATPRLRQPGHRPADELRRAPSWRATSATAAAHVTAGPRDPGGHGTPAGAEGGDRCASSRSTRGMVRTDEFGLVRFGGRPREGRAGRSAGRGPSRWWPTDLADRVSCVATRPASRQ